VVVADSAKRVSECMLRSKDQVSNSLSFMDKLLAKDVSKGKIQEIEAKEARERITVLDYDTQGIQGFRDVDMVIEVIASVLVHVCCPPDDPLRPSQKTYSSSARCSNLFLKL
jgi:3-hydroxyacyl-CoA dehydrogenase